MGSRRKCSFCLKTPPSDHRMVAGPGVYICAVCIATSRDLIQRSEGQVFADQKIRPWETMSDQQILEVLPEIATVQAQLDGELHTWVRLARQRGLSWSKIGIALNVTRQTAWERFATPD